MQQGSFANDVTRSKAKLTPPVLSFVTTHNALNDESLEKIVKNLAGIEPPCSQLFSSLQFHICSISYMQHVNAHELHYYSYSTGRIP